MPLVATLISSPARPALDAALADRAANAAGASLKWLAPNIAADLVLPEGIAGEAADAAIRLAIDGAPIDVVVQEEAGRRKKILLADMDSTMIGQECIDELAEEAGLKAHVSAITERAMRGEIAFEPALRERVALLAGLDVHVVDEVLRSRITLTPGARELVATMRANGGWTALVSGGFTAFTGPVSARIGFDEHRANRLLAENGRLAGTVAEPILGRQAKAHALREIAASRGSGTEDVLAVGDGANDLDMLRLAGSGVAFHAKPAVAAQASIRIDHGDLTALLYLQGYRIDEFAA